MGATDLEIVKRDTVNLQINVFSDVAQTTAVNIDTYKFWITAKVNSTDADPGVLQVSSTAYTKDSIWVDQSYLNATPCLAFEDSCIAETAPSGGSCSYTSGDFTIACGTCNVTDNEALGNNDIIFTGTGNVLITSNVSGVTSTQVNSCGVQLQGSISG